MTQNLVSAFDASDQETALTLFADIAAMSPDSAGVSRPAFSQRETETLAYLEQFATSVGLICRYDGAMNLVISLPNDADAKQYILIGSHVDTVPMGGNYDGLAGVLAGLMCLTQAAKSQTKFDRPVKVIAMRAEESAWFGPCYIASKTLTGTLEASELQALHRDDGRSLDAHMAGIGIDMTPIRNNEPLLNTDDILEYIELHIEQGPLLIGKAMPAAIVSGIRGNIRYQTIRCIGEAGHSGAVPRAFRKDPVLAMADLLVRLDESWLTILQKGGDLVLTSGIVATDPAKHAMTRIPDQVEFSLDFRSQDVEVLTSMDELLRDEIKEVERDRKVKFELGKTNLTAPALMNTQVVSGLADAMENLGLERMVMASGGGHDAAVFSNAGVASAMIFVRNQNGSHNPNEAMEIEDFMVGAAIIYEYLAGN